MPLHFDGSHVFDGFVFLPVVYYSKTLVKHGFSYSGKDFIYSGLGTFPSENYLIFMSND